VVLVRGRNGRHKCVVGVEEVEGWGLGEVVVHRGTSRAGRVVEGHLVRMQAPSHFTLETRAHTRTNLHTHTHTRTFSLCMFVTHACDSPTASVFFIIYFWDGIFSEEFGRKNFFLARVRFLYRICLARAFFYSIRVRDRVRLYSSHCKK